MTQALSLPLEIHVNEMNVEFKVLAFFCFILFQKLRNHKPKTFLFFRFVEMFNTCFHLLWILIFIRISLLVLSHKIFLFISHNRVMYVQRDHTRNEKFKLMLILVDKHILEVQANENINVYDGTFSAYFTFSDWR